MPDDSSLFTGLKVLLAEDYQISREIAAEMLKDLGCDVDTAVNGQQAIDMYIASKYDVIFLDIDMPMSDGYQVARTIRQCESLDEKHHIPIIAMTANYQPSDKAQCFDAGMDDHISKPIRQEKLINTMKKHMQLEEK